MDLRIPHADVAVSDDDVELKYLPHHGDADPEAMNGYGEDAEADTEV